MNEHDFSTQPVAITVCADPAYCGKATVEAHPEAGEGAIFLALKAARNELGLKGKVMVQKTTCQGWCDYAPVATVWPDGRVYRDIKPDEAADFIRNAALEDTGAFAARKVWDFRKEKKENQEERRMNGVVNPSQAEA